MRHNKKFNHLSRTASHRDALLANLSVSLIMHKRITTTVAKAKALKQYVEPLITRCKKDDTNSRRVVFRYLQNKEAVKELFSAVAEKVQPTLPRQRPPQRRLKLKKRHLRLNNRRIHYSLISRLRNQLIAEPLCLSFLSPYVVDFFMIDVRGEQFGSR